MIYWHLLLRVVSYEPGVGVPYASGAVVCAGHDPSSVGDEHNQREIIRSVAVPSSSSSRSGAAPFVDPVEDSERFGIEVLARRREHLAGV